MSAARLREAAELLRELAATATPGPWGTAGNGDQIRVYVNCVNGTLPTVAMLEHSTRGNADADYIATMHPFVGLALANLLEHAAARVDSKVEHGGIERAVWSTERDALNVADAILGSTR